MNFIKEHKVKEKYNVFITDKTNDVKINIICNNIDFLNEMTTSTNEIIKKIYYK